jgi:hypothetical protein
MTTAWLIERLDVHLCYSNGDTSFRWVTFTDPKAWRFETKEEALRVIAEHALTGVKAVSHGWADVPPSRDHATEPEGVKDR